MPLPATLLAAGGQRAGQALTDIAPLVLTTGTRQVLATIALFILLLIMACLQWYMTVGQFPRWVSRIMGRALTLLHLRRTSPNAGPCDDAERRPQ
ncbi:hypothetical protein AB0L44_15025 [Nonomuraea wenchangensis]|uniref:hypothetical protein n=1 Tax=Nonomuraea wenchangensis TaxID=568860 RepID=UPI00341E1EFE